MTNKTLHIVVDPLCGWTYGAAPLMDTANQLDRLDVEVHNGGMFVGERKRAITPQWRDFVWTNDEKITQVTQQTFSKDYSVTLLNNDSFVLDSEPPITAILAMKEHGIDSLEILNRIQYAYYVKGKNITQLSVLEALAIDLGIDRTNFIKSYNNLKGERTLRHINNSRALLQTINGRGFPSAALEFSEQVFIPLNIDQYYGDKEGWSTHLHQQLSHC